MGHLTVRRNFNKKWKSRFILEFRRKTNHATGCFSNTKELVINSFENDKDYLIVVDIQTGELLSKVDVNARLANGMFLSPFQ